MKQCWVVTRVESLPYLVSCAESSRLEVCYFMLSNASTRALGIDMFAVTTHGQFEHQFVGSE